MTGGWAALHEGSGGTWLRRDSEAEASYRACWNTWMLTSHRNCNPGKPCEGRLLEQLMTDLQPYISKGPEDPRWRAFASTLGGFQEYWYRRIVTEVIGTKVEDDTDEDAVTRAAAEAARR